MSKQVLKAGSLVIGGQSLGLLDVAVIDSPTKLDISNTANNNLIALGRDNWAFSATAMKNNAQMVIPTRPVKETIVITFGGECWYGDGFVTTVELSGTLDDKVVYKIQGEFVPDSYHIAGPFNMVLEGGGDGVAPDGWTFTPLGGAVQSIEFDDKDGRYWFIDTIGIGTVKQNIGTVESGETYGHCIVYASDNLTAIQTFYESGGSGQSHDVTPADTGGAVTIWTYNTHSPGGSEDRFAITDDPSGGGAYLKLFSANFGKILKSLT